MNRITGVTVVSLQDSEATSSSSSEEQMVLLGDFIALLGAGFYGCYTTLLKLRIQHESRVDMTLFFGFVGLYCFIFLWPFNIALSVLGVEPLELPPTKAVVFCILVLIPRVDGCANSKANMLITFVSDYLWILAMLMTSPLIVTMGLSLSIPLALFGDFLFKGQVKGLYYWLGAILVLVGFSIVNVRREDNHPDGVEQSGTSSNE
jgi:solute carrier family 35, member F5